MGSFEGGWLIAGESKEAVDGGPCALNASHWAAPGHTLCWGALGLRREHWVCVFEGERGCFPQKSQHSAASALQAGTGSMSLS